MAAPTADLIRACIEPVLPFAERLFAQLREHTADGPGVSREPYAAGEQFAHDLLATAAREHGLEVATDRVGNLYMTLPGADRALPGWITGSHLDSVPIGGNFDGAAGVIAGLTTLVGLRQGGVHPLRDITVMGVRAEEVSSWFGGSHNGHIGSRAALGQLDPTELDKAINARTGITLAQQMHAAGFPPGAFASTPAHLQAARYRGYLELHIEQGPVLERQGLPVGVVTGIRGSLRARSARCIGAYTHSGAVPHEYRSDAVLATVALVAELDREWARIRTEGGDLVFTVGKFFTDAQAHSITKVPGEVAFSIDLRSEDLATLQAMERHARALAESIAVERRVRFDLGAFDLSPPAAMEPGLQALLSEGSRELGIACGTLPSGAGHDAQDFAHAGFPAGMVFVRNANGSHNPEEAMDIADFNLGMQVLAWALTR